MDECYKISSLFSIFCQGVTDFAVSTQLSVLLLNINDFIYFIQQMHSVSAFYLGQEHWDMIEE